MNDIFIREEQIVAESNDILLSNKFTTATDAKLFENLLDEYKKMLRQMRSLVKISDMTEGKLNSMSYNLEQLSNIDELTKLYNRRCFNDTYSKEWYNACLLHIPLGLLMIDIDYFKNYNDKFGHLQGDECLKKIAAIIRNTVNCPNDFVARFGGEEFIVLMPNTELSGCAVISEKIIKNISMQHFKSPEGTAFEHVTVSIGINSMFPSENIDMEVLINGADRALYKAKEDGRNCYRAI
jgi:diguanylate cyclase (GGDEF)-like protein